jgi:hypothetical protein
VSEPLPPDNWAIDPKNLSNDALVRHIVVGRPFARDERLKRRYQAVCDELHRRLGAPTREDRVREFAFTAGVMVCGLWKVYGGKPLTDEQVTGLGRLLFQFFKLEGAPDGTREKQEGQEGQEGQRGGTDV